MPTDAQSLPSLSTFRDVGASLRARDPRLTAVRERLFYIGGAREKISDADGATLRDEHGIKTLVDTKNGTRLKVKPAPNNERKNGVDDEGPEFGIISVLGLRYCWICLYTVAYSRAMWTAQSSWSKLKMFTNAAAGKWDLIESRASGVAIERGPIIDTFDSLTYAQPEIRELFNRVLSDPTAYPVLICGGPSLHVAHLLWILVLSILEVPIDTIQEDYIANVDNISEDSALNELQAKFLEGLLAKRSEWVGAVKDHLECKYGGVEAYLIKAGVTENAIDSVKEILSAHRGERLLDI